VTELPRPGWYPDPAGPESPGLRSFRWWDGSAWTDQTSERSDDVAPDSGRSRSRWRVGAAAVVAFALVATAAMGGLFLSGQDPAQTASARQSDPPSGAGPEPIGQLDLQTRVARIGAVTMTMPANPYAVTPDPLHLSGVLEVVFLSSAPVHPSYDGIHTWSSAVLFGRLADPPLGSEDLAAQGRRVLQELSRTMFDGRTTQVEKLHWSDQAVSGRAGLTVTARVHYRIPQLPSRYDTVTAQLVRLEDGAVLLALSSVPDDADSETVSQADQAVRSMQVD